VRRASRWPRRCFSVAGPAWVGLAGSDVAGYTVVMPTIELTDEEIDAVVAYIEGL
jgi:hypothetical protein